MKGTLQDLKMAEDLYAQDRSGDALTIIDRVLQLSVDASADDTVGILRQALQHIEEGRLRAMSKITDRGDGMALILFSPLKIALDGSEVPNLVLLRAKCLVELIEQTHLKIWVNRAVSNSHAIWKLFSGDADLLALAAQPFLMIGERQTAAMFLSRALACDSQSRLVNNLIAHIRAQGWQDPLAPEPNFVPPPRLLPRR